MRTNRYEFMRPQEILDAQKEKSIVYLPIGPLEWHGPAMPFGTDPLAAEVSARMIVERTGGVVLPTLYVGTERERDAQTLDAMGFAPDEYVIGQDVPKATLPSFYLREEIFSLIIREYLRILVKQNYKLIVILNGHGAANQNEVLQRLCAEFTNETDSTVVATMAVAVSSDLCALEGHASKAETSVQIYLDADNVDLSQLPPKSVKLKNSDWGINSCSSYNGHPNADKTVEDEVDPRNADVEYGRKCIELGVDKVVDEVNELWIKIKKKQ